MKLTELLEQVSPLPWMGDCAFVLVAREGGEDIGEFYGGEDALYAAHAASVLPEVVAALRAMVERYPVVPHGQTGMDRRDWQEDTKAQREAAKALKRAEEVRR